jgi:hypothetical protein
MLIQTKSVPDKNPIWSHWTPNECYENEELSLKHLKFPYSEFVESFVRSQGLVTKRVWREVRVVNKAPSIEIATKSAWWEQPEFADRIFWVFNNPTVATIDNDRYFCHVLEPIECLRVVKAGIDKYGYNPFSVDFPCLYLPCELAKAAWDETSGGYSDHLREREVHEPTQQEIEEDAVLEEKAKEIEKNIQEATDEQFGDIVPGKRI